MDTPEVRSIENRLWLLPLSDTSWEVGITKEYLQNLGQIMYIEVESKDALIASGKRIALLESAKAVVEISLPTPVTIEEINTLAIDDPNILAKGPSQGWLVRVKTEESTW